MEIAKVSQIRASKNEKFFFVTFVMKPNTFCRDPVRKNPLDVD